MIVGAGLTEAEVNGVHPAADWSHWIRRGRAPDSASGCEFEANMNSDIEMLASLGVSELLVTIEWSRLQPGPWVYDQLQVELLRHFMAQLIDAGIAPWGCLLDGTLPGWFSEDDGGFEVSRSRNLVWPRHVEWVAETFGDLVAGWVPQREPIRRAVRSNLLNLAPRGRRSAVETGKAIANALRAEGDALRVLKGSQPVALFHTGQTFHPEVDNVRAAPEARWLDQLFNAVLPNALNDGVIDIPEGPRVECDVLRDGFDRIVTQLRPPIQIDGDGHWSLLRAPLLDVHAEQIDRHFTMAGDRECVIAGDLSLLGSSEFGASEDQRADGLNQLVGVVAGASTGHKADAGWWQMSPIDGWHWEHGFGVNPGLADRKRNLRPSAEVLLEYASQDTTSEPLSGQQ